MEAAGLASQSWPWSGRRLVSFSEISADSDDPREMAMASLTGGLRRRGRSWPYLLAGGVVLLTLTWVGAPAASWHGGAALQRWAFFNLNFDTTSTTTTTTATATTTSTTATTTTTATTITSTSTTTTTMTTLPPAARDNDVYCWLVTQSSGEEAGLVRDHYVRGHSIFSCKGWSVFTDKDVLAPLSAVTNIGPVKSTEGPWGSWINTKVFLRAWDAVIKSGKYKDYSWTVKVDAATIFLPGRLKAHVDNLSPDEPWFLKNDGMLLAPVEVLSRAAVGLYAAKGRKKCTNAGAKMGQEDTFLDYCLHAVGAKPKADEHLLMDCGEPESCGDRRYLAYYPFETSGQHDACAKEILASEKEEPEDEGLAGFCCLWGTDCYSCPEGNKPNRSTYCGKNPKSCLGCGAERATWCMPPRKPVKCGSRRVLRLYHQTSNHICDLILQSNFRAGKVGWCGGGIYFALDAQATNTKCIGPQSKTGCILQVKVDVGKTWFKGKKCNRSLLGEDVLAEGYGSVSFDPSDGQEYAIYNNSQVLSIRRYGWWLPDAQVKAAHWDVYGR